MSCDNAHYMNEEVLVFWIFLVILDKDIYYFH